MKAKFKDHFSSHADMYAQYRPHYPEELFEFIVSNVRCRDTAWDCATGNGQAAIMLSHYFKRVIATDASANQIKHAPKKENVFYQVSPAEKTDLKDGSIDLVTVAAAIHWFAFDDFYKEVGRVSKDGSVIAVWTYDEVLVSKTIDPILRNFYRHTVGAYWPEGRKYVDEKYETVPFPFRKIDAPDFNIELIWTLEQLKGYLRTWSSVQKYIERHSGNPIDLIEKDLQSAWGTADKKNVTFPLFLKIGVIEK